MGLGADPLVTCTSTYKTKKMQGMMPGSRLTDWPLSSLSDHHVIHMASSQPKEGDNCLLHPYNVLGIIIRIIRIPSVQISCSQ